MGSSASPFADEPVTPTDPSGVGGKGGGAMSPSPEGAPGTALPDDPEDLTGAQKAATLLIALGVETASDVLKHLNDKEVEKVSVEVARMRNAPSELVEEVLLEYRDVARAQDYVTKGGVEYAREVLNEALGNRRAEEVMMRVEAAMEVSAFHLLQTVETDQLTGFLRREHPQTAALILAHLNPRKAAEIISGLEEELQSEIMYRLATIGNTSPEMINDIEEVIRNQLGSVIGAETSVMGGIEQAAEILNTTSRSSEKNILDNLRDRSEELASDIKNLMFVFDDLTKIRAEDLQKLLMEVDQEDLALGLKGASDELENKVMRNVSDRVAEALDEEIELLGRVRVSDVEEAQNRILEIAQELEEKDEIALSSASEEAVIE
ncbi:flagellar motor switch protein FliG [Salinibacter ruber]|uniref:Flagellar motor switch protein FliG n=1 Tax=Salinibacter ruber TaxID=146919 RepID=A0A9X2Z232_9BACT|nr:flagellar motor switch protein FliG [Salinibacter ruber]MCS3656233.1 flagellar motor switch protein FliG [Salinibacter ruber]MCS3950254.1 flagellar motor switch protein FliG [Salinibacter ruber]MCS4117017.1 flagellar motor switch protein FliG [Salinibacter ruber]MCS4153857.1 flagellar motor switch protein FliG [Salinibacter ruber]MCS4169651.1 flagellar motor switch protein FliG [Salinibacter ruber]